MDRRGNHEEPEVYPLASSWHVCIVGIDSCVLPARLSIYRTAPDIMRQTCDILSFLLVLWAASLGAAATWGFEDATVSVNKKGAGVGGGFKEKF